MFKGILGKKVGMTQVYDENENVIPVTVIQAGPCTVMQVKTKAKDQYTAVQLGFEERKEKHTHKPQLTYCKKNNLKPQKFVREIRMDEKELENFKLGQEIKVDVFNPNDFVDVIGVMKGRGFSGVVKRHNFKGCLSESHGTCYFKRHGGSMGNRFAQHTPKGRGMAGQWGHSPVTVQSLRVVRIHSEHNLLLVKGAVPGPNNGYLVIRQAKKRLFPMTPPKQPPKAEKK